METLVGVHHFYGGIGVAMLGYLIIALCRRRKLANMGLLIVVVGVLIMADDIWQYSVQYVRQDNYASPCKRIFYYVSPRCPIIRKTVVVADRLFRWRGSKREAQEE